MTTTSKRKLLSHKEFAKLLGCHRATLHRWRSAGLVPDPVYIGDTPKFKADEVEAWLDACCPPARKWRYEKQL